MTFPKSIERTLVQENQKPIEYVATWDGKNEYGRKLKFGIYICSINANLDFLNKKIVFIE